MTDAIIRADIYELMKEAVKDGLAIVRRAEVNDGYISDYHDFPIMNQFPSGLPYFRKSYLFLDKEIPKDYKRIFTDKENPPHDIPSWQRFWDFALKDPFISHFWRIGDNLDKSWYSSAIPDWEETYTAGMVFKCIRDLVDRYVHVTGIKELDEDLFRPVYVEWELSVFSERLPINIIIPILGVTFPFEKFELSGGTLIEKMNDHFQLARNTICNVLNICA